METKNNFQEQEPKKIRRVIIEIGTSSLPTTYTGERKIAEDEAFVGIDINHKDLQSARKNTSEKQALNDNIFFVQADAADLPISTNSVEEVYMANVMGDSSIDAKWDFLREIRRILINGGKLIINETNTPMFTETIIKLLRHFGFDISEMHKIGDYDWDRVTKDYEKSDVYGYSHNKSSSYLLVAKKHKDNELN